ncbi:HSF-type DNA-binding protein, putative [Phytophthora infestans T30-4]|uniref:HSF-type DNA-binding protein, putative n=1 Tax=Phytophthora infestans (strain T30-4) TaxID=403677 RepID=D0NIH1_PHYIT|nr:HSF-type DNA-binding protein, putative [Phytophthora infestans T30-4]EEY59256.1 HSF-type DNA-binding protein, putative [Phytophthora infestans T30-4]|eukprot:XP_002901270.1 HSF-type DNA-binding protein, putative [Phytophthora infestans T30-4]
MLLDESDTVLRWTPDGRAFEIHDMQEMTARVLPKYFKHCKYTSFQRQLNYFNFRKWTKSKAVVCTFSNDFFLRDQPELAWRITRKKSLSPHQTEPLDWIDCLLPPTDDSYMCMYPPAVPFTMNSVNMRKSFEFVPSATL